jgi:hypothetical protein
MSRVLRSIRVTFDGEGAIEYAVSYQHRDEPPSPGTKARTATAARMARKGLEAALEALSSGPMVWGGFATDARKSTDTVMIDRKEHAA